MATFNNFPEEGRPPDSPPSANRKCHPRRTHFNSWSYTHHSADTVNNNNNNNLTLDINLNQQLPKVQNNLKTKLLCINNNTKRKSDTSASIKLCDNRLSPKPSSKRSSFHQDVEEALQSLLWQPYEYQVTPDQWKCGVQSREPVSVSASRLSSGEEASLLEVLDDDGDIARRVLISSDCGDVCTSDSDMHLEVTAAHNPDHLLNIGHEDALSSANVVGLPEAATLVPPSHSRNGSEPSSAGFRVVPTHPRSASVPKSLGSLASTKKTMSVNNISNVNVNFYRAVPVNVVSAVPTIQCLNTMDEGNNVSNVQIMPLGSSTATTTPLTSTGTVSKVLLRFTQIIDYLIDRMIGFFVEHLLGYGPLFGGTYRPTDV